MKLLVNTNVDPSQRELGTGGYNLPNSTITWLSVIYIFINVVANSLGNIISYIPQKNYENKILELKNQNFQLQLLQRVLEINIEKDRKLSLELVVKAGLLDKNKGEDLLDYIKTNEHIPQWPARTLEVLNSYLTSQGISYTPSVGNYPNIGSGNLNTQPGNTSNTTLGNSGSSVQRSTPDSAKSAGN